VGILGIVLPVFVEIDGGQGVKNRGITLESYKCIHATSKMFWQAKNIIGEIDAICTGLQPRRKDGITPGFEIGEFRAVAVGPRL
jgi:hypothetical protein